MIRDLLGIATATSLSSPSLEKVRTLPDKRFKVTSRSPHTQKSSKCGSIEEPLSGMYSKLHSSTGWKSCNSGTIVHIRSTKVLLNCGSPVKLSCFNFFFLKFTWGPKSCEKSQNNQNGVSSLLYWNCKTLTFSRTRAQTTGKWQMKPTRLFFEIMYFLPPGGRGCTPLYKLYT